MSDISPSEAPAFDCMMCGHCCEGAGGIVVSRSDLERLCAHLAVTGEGFAQRWGQRRGEKLFVRTENGRCIFFEQGAGCSVHAAKPDICRAWPYFRGNLLDSESLALAKDFCPGIPREQSHEDFVHEGLGYLRSLGLEGNGQADEAAALQVADLQDRSGMLADDDTKR